MALAIDLYCGLGGWTEGLLAEGFNVIGFDNERHEYGEHRYPAQLVVQDVLTLHGCQFKDADLIVASPPCTEYSYMAMPWSRAKQIAAAFKGEADFPEGYTGSRTLEELNRLFDACFRIQREASEAGGRHVPLVVENVKGAQPWVGPARWNFGSFYLWGDVPALMPMVRRGFKSQGLNWSDREKRGQDSTRVAGNQAIKNGGGSWFNVAHNTNSGKGQNPDGRKIQASCSERRWEDREIERLRDTADSFGWSKDSPLRNCNIKSIKRKMASAMIAKIPLPLAQHIGRVYAP